MTYALEHRGGRTLPIDPAIYLKAIKARLACVQAQGARSIWIDHRDGLWHGTATHTALISALEQLAAEGHGLVGTICAASKACGWMSIQKWLWHRRLSVARLA